MLSFLSSLLPSVTVGSVATFLGGGVVGYLVPKVKSALTSVESKLAAAKASVVALETKIKAKL